MARIAALGALLVAVGALLAWPAAGVAGETVISSAGPLGAIAINGQLACQVQATGDGVPDFYSEAGFEGGGCGTFLALTAGEGIEPTSGHTFGSTPPPGVPIESAYEEVAQTSPSADTIVTTAYVANEAKTRIAELAETDTYVPGQDSYETTLRIVNLGDSALAGAIYHVGDCYLADDDYGYGAANVPSAGSVACTVEPDDNPPDRFMAFTPISATEGIGASSYFEGRYPAFWEGISAEAKPLPDTVEAATFDDNGMGMSWPVKLAAADSKGDEATLKLSTTVSPYSAPSASASAPACDPSGAVPVTVTAADGARAVHYSIDGGAAATVATSATGQATISVPAGQHTLEYWGEDLSGNQSAHNVVSLTVGAGAPGLTFTSEQGRAGYEVGEAGSVSIAASGVGLTSNPSATHVPLSTATPGTYTIARSAANACGTTSASFTYTVISKPTLGKTVNVVPVSGKVYVAVPAGASAASLTSPLLETAVESLSKGLKFVPLTEARQIPVGSTFEATAGVARITTATASVGKTQSGEFGAGIFKLLQNRKQKGLTELNIVDNRSSKQVCASVGKKAAVAAKLSSKTLGRLTGSAHGKFTTKGQYSAATVRGTSWGVTNQCDGTLTKVKRGEVNVRVFRTRKTLTLFTGQSYLAKA